MLRRPPLSSSFAVFALTAVTGASACAVIGSVDLGAVESSPSVVSSPDARASDDADGDDATVDARPATDEGSVPDARPREAGFSVCGHGQAIDTTTAPATALDGGPLPATLPGWKECTPVAGTSACSLDARDSPPPLRLRASFFVVAPTELAIAGARLCQPIVPGAKYSLAFDTAVEAAPFDGGNALPDLSVSVWAGPTPCEPDLPLKNTANIPSTCAWTANCLTFVATPDAMPNFQYLILQAYSGVLDPAFALNESDYVLIDNLRFVDSCVQTAGIAPP